jgi:hypothetical protein
MMAPIMRAAGDGYFVNPPRTVSISSDAAGLAKIPHMFPDLG